MTMVKLIGPPGTGKTTTLSRWARGGAAKYGAENIMLCSLTKTAAAEIGSRDTGIPNDNIGTLHSHAFRLMEDKKEVWGSKKHIEEWNSLYPGYQIAGEKTVDDMGARMNRVPAGDTFKAQADLLRARMTPRELWPDDALRFYEVFEHFKGAFGIIDFTDMIEYALNNCDAPFEYLIADEAQDYSSMEFALLQKWGRQCLGGVIAGDSLQTLYEWRGASVEGFIEFGDEKRVLSQSYRVPQAVHRYAMTLADRIALSEVGEYYPTDVEGSVIKAYRSAIDPVGFADSLEGTTMMLTTCGYMTLSWCKELKKRGIPYHNPYRKQGEHAGTWNPLAYGKKKTTAADRVRAFLSPPWNWKEFEKWASQMGNLPRGQKLQMRSKKKDVPGELVPATILIECLGVGGMQAALAGDLNWYRSNLLSSAEPRLNYQIRVAEKGLVSETPKIIVGTIHSVKGGEADNVIICPEMSVAAMMEWSKVSPDPMLRAFYVGVTRAKKNVYLVPERGAALFRW